MFFDLSFPSLDPWTDLEELLDPPEQAEEGTERSPPGPGAHASPSPSPPPPVRGDGERVGARR